jgi:hypothetical protein
MQTPLDLRKLGEPALLPSAYLRVNTMRLPIFRPTLAAWRLGRIG